MAKPAKKKTAKAKAKPIIEGLCSLSDYARERGCSVTAIRLAIQDGRVEVVRRDAQKVYIDPRQADRDWPREDVAPKNPGGSTLNGERTLKEKTIRELKEIDLAEKRKELVSAAQVKKDFFEIARKVRDNLLNIPGRIAPEIAAEVDPHRCEILLDKEIREVLEGLAYELR